MTRRLRWVLLLASTALILAPLRPLAAQSPPPPPLFIDLDARAFPYINLRITGPTGPPPLTGLMISEHNEQVSNLSLSREYVGVSVVVLLDLSRRGMGGAGRIEAVRRQIADLALALDPQTDHFALYGYHARVETICKLGPVNGGAVRNLVEYGGQGEPCQGQQPRVQTVSAPDAQGNFRDDDLAARTNLEGAINQALNDLQAAETSPRHAVIVIFGGTCHDIELRYLKPEELSCELSQALTDTIAARAAATPLSFFSIFVRDRNARGERPQVLDAIAGLSAGRAQDLFERGAITSERQSAFQREILSEIDRRRIQVRATYTASIEDDDQRLERIVTIALPDSSNGNRYTSTRRSYNEPLRPPRIELESTGNSPGRLVVQVMYQQTPIKKVEFKDADNQNNILQTDHKGPFELDLTSHAAVRAITVEATDASGGVATRDYQIPASQLFRPGAAWLLVGLGALLIAALIGLIVWRPWPRKAEDPPAAPPPSEPEASEYFLLDCRTREEYPLKVGATLIGSAEGAHIRLNTIGVQPEHALINCDHEGKVSIRPANNGIPVFVNNLEATGTDLRPFDLITLGEASGDCVNLQCFRRESAS